MRGDGQGLRHLSWRGMYSATDDRVNDFYLPALGQAVQYDRLVGYWRSSSLLVAATGIARLARRKGRIRLIAGADLTEDDITAIRDGQPLEATVARRLMDAPDEAEDVVAAHRWEVLAWMLREGILEIRIGVPIDEQGELLSPAHAQRIFHSKYGILTDANGDQLVFSGSDNESAQGWRRNHETFHVFKSWGPAETWQEHGRPSIEDFDRHWAGELPEWRVIEFPDEARDHLLRRAPAGDDWIPPLDPQEPQRQHALEELRELRDAPGAGGGSGVGFVTLPIEPWPHQTSIAGRVLATWPRSYLLADEVGLGKTIEAGLIIRELLLTGKAQRILLLVPASVLRQWQEELWEKFCLDVPVYDGSMFRSVDGRPAPGPSGSNPWSAHPVTLASSHLARMRSRRQQLLAAAPWDLVLVDEAHHARSRGEAGKAGANQLLQLLREMREAKVWKAVLLATATPMQMNTHEVYDLLDILGLPGRWGGSAGEFEAYYRQLAEEDPKARDWLLLRTMLADYLAQPVDPNPIVHDRVRAASGPFRMLVETLHVYSVTGADIAARPPEQQQLIDQWLRANTPIRDRAFRTTREALREYQRLGILDAGQSIPKRQIDDRFIPLGPDEDTLYQRIDDYISRYYEAYNRATETKPLGFIMTVYRRRLTSSLYAVRQSLQRRLDTLRADAAVDTLLDEDDRYALEHSVVFDADTVSEAARRYGDEAEELTEFLAALDVAIPTDTKVQQLTDDIREAFEKGHRTVVVFTQFADTLTWLRDQLQGTYGEQIACYTGAGGSRWDRDERSWVRLEKSEVKELFRRGDEVRILLGTDALSEGLNLQTCDRLINYDMPWNFMRVEQRIGRVDRIGGQPTVYVTNYFYRDTVEEQIYTGIREDAQWFDQVVGPAQPVLSRVESVIQDLAMRSPGDARRQAIEEELAAVRRAIAEAADRPLTLDDIDVDQPDAGGYAHRPRMDLAGIERILTSNVCTEARMEGHSTYPRTYTVALQDGACTVTFDRAVYERHADLDFMTYGQPVFEQLLAESIDG